LSLTQLHPGHATEPAIGDERAIATGKMRLELIKELAQPCPLSLVPRFVQGHHPPRQRYHAALYEQTHIDDACPIAIGRTLQHQVEPFALPVWQDLLKKLLPDIAHDNASVRDEASQSPFNTGHLGLGEPVFCQTLSDALQHGTARDDDPSHTQR
jgi:hypothetical protein